MSFFEFNKDYPKGHWLICSPDFYTVSYEINPWMSVKRAPLESRAKQQWLQLKQTFEKIGAKVEVLEGVPELPDLVFTANAGLAKNKKFLLAKFKFKERQGEEKVFEQWFDKSGFQVIKINSKYNYEGEGDTLFADEKLFAGYGFRSDANGYDFIADSLQVKDLILCEMINPYFYHLDTCFAPISNQKALIFLEAFSKNAIKKMENEIELISVVEQDAKKFVCNAVPLGKDIIIPAGCDETYAKLGNLGYQVHPCELDEYIKAGGAAKCLCLRLDR